MWISHQEMNPVMTNSGSAGGEKGEQPGSPGNPEITPMPTDIGEDVRADLEAAFDLDATRLRIKDDATAGYTARDSVQDGNLVKDLAQEDLAQEDLAQEDLAQVRAAPRVAEGENTPRRRSFFGGRKRRRSILEIARDYDTRLKAQAELQSSQVVAKKNDQANSATSAKATSAIDSGVGIGARDDLVEIAEVDEQVDGFEGDDLSGSKKRVVITDDTIDVDRSSLRSRRSAQGRGRRFSFRHRTEEDDELSRLRKKRRASQRIDGKWRPRWYTVTGAVVLLFVAVLLLLTSPLLSIREIEVEGNVYANPNLLDAVIDGLSGDPILTADLHGAKVQLEAIPWVRKARVSMLLPTRVLIQVDERTPLAFVRSVDGFNRVLDRDGRVLDVIEGDPTNYVRIIGTAPSLVAGDFVSQPFLGVAQLINALPRDLADRLISATVSPEGEISLQFTPNLQVIFGAPADYQAKLVGVINEIKRQGTKSYTVIDVSAGEPNVR
jgi:cell division protein FtsQ